VAGLELVAM